jgi:DNA primase
MERYEIQKLRDLPIEGVAERLGLRVNRHKSLCPFHDDHNPSLTFNVRRNTYRCYACGAHGDTISLAMGVLANNSFLEACRWLANEHNVILTEYKPKEPNSSPKGRGWEGAKYARYFQHPWLSPDACKFLFEKRHLNPAVVKYCRLNSFRDWLQIPYFNREGKLIGIQSRYLGTDPTQPRFRFPYGEGCHIYNLPVLRMLQPREDLYITEGSSDCWAMLSAGHKAIAIPSATLLNKRELQSELTEAHLLENENALHTYPDKDNAGESLYRELLTLATDMGLLLIRHDLPDGCKDFSDLWKSKALSVKC